MPRYIAYVSTVLPVFVIADNEDDVYGKVDSEMKKYWEDAYDLETVISNCAIEYVEYDSDVEVVEQKEDVNLAEKVIKACMNYIKSKGYKVIESKNDNPNCVFDIVGKDSTNNVVFIDVSHSNGTMPEDNPKTRSQFEDSAFKWFDIHREQDDAKCSYDIINMNVMGSLDRALLRHHINVYGAAM